jgi:hypothetical protein
MTILSMLAWDFNVNLNNNPFAASDWSDPPLSFQLRAFTFELLASTLSASTLSASLLFTMQDLTPESLPKLIKLRAPCGSTKTNRPLRSRRQDRQDVLNNRLPCPPAGLGLF